VDNEVFRAAGDKTSAGFQLPGSRSFYGSLFKRQTSERNIKRNSGRIADEEDAVAESKGARVFSARLKILQQLVHIFFVLFEAGQ
jgi:hypothetical protein